MLDLFFQDCCNVCIIGANSLGLSYGEFCILVFCYIQPIIMLLFGVLNIKHLFGKLTILSMILYLWFYSQYSISTKSFYRIYNDLHHWANSIGITYIEINILLYIIIPIIIISTNYILFKTNKKQIPDNNSEVALNNTRCKNFRFWSKNQTNL